MTVEAAPAAPVPGGLSIQADFLLDAIRREGGVVEHAHLEPLGGTTESYFELWDAKLAFEYVKNGILLVWVKPPARVKTKVGIASRPKLHVGM
jgi:hypothetical protein